MGQFSYQLDIFFFVLREGQSILETMLTLAKMKASLKSVSKYTL